MAAAVARDAPLAVPSGERRLRGYEATVQSAAKAPTVSRGLPFQMRGGMQTILSLRLLAPRDPNFFPLLLDKIAHSPDFFREAPVVLDVAAIVGEPPAGLEDLVGKLRQHRLMPVGVQHGSAAWNEAALALNLAVFGEGGMAEAPAQRPARQAPRRDAAAPVGPRHGPAITVAEPIRGGQQVHSPEGDLVVMAMVGHGAEIAAAGHIHVYGTLRGRAFAGIGGDEQAMIFCDQLDAELLSIAGVHLVNEEIDPGLIGRRVRVRLERDRLALQALG